MSRTEKDVPYWVKRKRAAIDRELKKKISSSDFMQEREYVVEDFVDISLPEDAYWWENRYMYKALFKECEVVAGSEIATDVAVETKNLTFNTSEHVIQGKDIEALRLHIVDYVNRVLRLKGSKSAYDVSAFNAFNADNLHIIVHIGNGDLVRVVTTTSVRYYHNPALFGELLTKGERYLLDIAVFYSENLYSGDNVIKYKGLLKEALEDSNFRFDVTRKVSSCSCKSCFYGNKSYRNAKKYDFLSDSKTDFNAEMKECVKLFNTQESEFKVDVENDKLTGKDKINDIRDFLDSRHSLSKEFLSFDMDCCDKSSVFAVPTDEYNVDDVESVEQLHAEVSISKDVLDAVKYNA